MLTPEILTQQMQDERLAGTFDHPTINTSHLAERLQLELQKHSVYSAEYDQAGDISSQNISYVERFGPFDVQHNPYRRTLTQEAQEMIDIQYTHDGIRRKEMKKRVSAVNLSGYALSSNLAEELSEKLPPEVAQTEPQESGLEWHLGYLVAKTLKAPTIDKVRPAKWLYTAFAGDDAAEYYGKYYSADPAQRAKQTAFFTLAGTEEWRMLTDSLLQIK